MRATYLGQTSLRTLLLWLASLAAAPLCIFAAYGPLATRFAWAQSPEGSQAAKESDDQWQRPRTTGRRTGSARLKSGAGKAGSSRTGLEADDAADDRPRPAKRGSGSLGTGRGGLPNDDGQVWREYDISPYTTRVTSSANPERALVDWILRETGYEAWHSDPVGVLSANSRTLRVYHTVEMQEVVADVVERFVDQSAESHAFAIRVVTVGHPNWRAKAQAVLHPVEVQTQGIQAWLVQKEDAALLVAELRKRMDYREHSSPQLLVNNGQSATIATTRPRTYTRDVTARAEAWPAFEPEVAQFDEGFTLEFSPLLARDAQSVDAVIRCQIDQLEKLVGVMLEVPTPVAPRQRTKIEVPQVSQFRLHERFRWPIDQVLVVGLGVVATPAPTEPGILGRAGLALPSGPPRADLLLFVESKGKGNPLPAGAERPERDRYRGRY